MIDTRREFVRLADGGEVSVAALCRRFGIDNSAREKHGALLDSEILAEVYLAMTGGQVGLSLDHEEDSNESGESGGEAVRRLSPQRPRLPVIKASAEEMDTHLQRVAVLDKAINANSLFRQLELTQTEADA